ncbi:MAG: hypothetical protein ACODAD_10490 [Planctomycetota bacterium]
MNVACAQERAILFDVLCQESDMENIPITRNVWGGDSVAILLETPFHSYCTCIQGDQRNVS